MAIKREMFHRRFSLRSLSILFLVGIVSMACALSTPTQAPATLVPPASPAASQTALPPSPLPPTAAVPSQTSPAATQTSPAATQPAADTNTPSVPTAASGPGVSPEYLDDRSTPTGLIQSYFNAINLKQYLRAYSYWESTSLVGPFNQFQQGYQETASVQVTLGVISEGRGAGQIYFTVPAALVAQTTGGKTQTFAACYTLHLGNPQIQAAPPFHPLAIATGVAKAAPNGTTPKDLLAHACDGVPQGVPVVPAPVTHPKDITAANYLDDRSGPVEVLSSLFNAVNRKEYARAYSYWESSSKVGPFGPYQKGYADTASVQLISGPVSSNAGAGQIYFTVPAVLIAKTTGGATRTFSACYILHLARPEIQGVPPFQPLAIRSATAKQVSNGSDPTTLLGQACANQP